MNNSYALARLDLPRLAKICGLFSSLHDGERASAAAHADRLLRDAGLTWPDVLGQEPRGAAWFETSRRREVPLTAGEILARHSTKLSAWHIDFLSNVSKRRSPLSPHQREILAELQARFTR